MILNIEEIKELLSRGAIATREGVESTLQENSDYTYFDKDGKLYFFNGSGYYLNAVYSERFGDIFNLNKVIL